MALLGPEPRLEEDGKNVVISVCVLLSKMLPDASKTGHRAQVPASTSADGGEPLGKKHPSYTQQGRTNKNFLPETIITHSFPQTQKFRQPGDMSGQVCS